MLLASGSKAQLDICAQWLLTPCICGYCKVTARAGTTLKELNHQLEVQGLAMNNLPSISEQTVAGAIMTGIVK